MRFHSGNNNLKVLNKDDNVDDNFFLWVGGRVDTAEVLNQLLPPCGGKFTAAGTRVQSDIASGSVGE